jgi:hypothetical protein
MTELKKNFNGTDNLVQHYTEAYNNVEHIHLNTSQQPTLKFL